MEIGKGLNKNSDDICIMVFNVIGFDNLNIGKYRK